MLQDIVDRIVVILTAAVTWIVAVSTAIAVFADEIVEVLPEAWQEPFTAGIVAALAVGTEIIAVIRRVTPVSPDLRGILPKPGSTPMEGVDH